MPSVEPDKLWLPSESHELAAFSKLRDLTECFPGASKVVIHIETGDGQLIANNALSTLNIKGRVIEEITFLTLWYGYVKTNRLLKTQILLISFLPYFAYYGIIRADSTMSKDW